MLRTPPTEEVLPHQREVVLSVLHVQLRRLLRSIAAEVSTITGNFVPLHRALFLPPFPDACESVRTQTNREIVAGLLLSVMISGIIEFISPFIFCSVQLATFSFLALEFLGCLVRIRLEIRTRPFWDDSSMFSHGKRMKKT